MSFADGIDIKEAVAMIIVQVRRYVSARKIV